MIRWEYEMHFDTEFMCILSGSVVSIIADDNNDTRTEMSRFGETLVYCNAGLFDEVRPRCGSSVVGDNGDRSSNTDDEEPGQQQAVVEIQQRLRNEGISVRTMAMIRTILLAASSLHGQAPRSANPFDYNIN